MNKRHAQTVAEDYFDSMLRRGSGAVFADGYCSAESGNHSSK